MFWFPPESGESERTRYTCRLATRSESGSVAGSSDSMSTAGEPGMSTGSTAKKNRPTS